MSIKVLYLETFCFKIICLPEYLIVPWNLQFVPPIFRSLTKMSTPANCGLWYLHWHLVWYWQHFLFWHFAKIFPVKFCKKGIAGINFLFSITPLITFFLCLSIFYLCQFQQCSRTFSHEHEYQLTLMTCPSTGSKQILST